MIYDLTKDENVFVCPERANVRGGVSVIHKTPENDDDWRIETAGAAVLREKRRGGLCMFYGANGPDNTVDTIHR